jgi:hypothetical protein
MLALSIALASGVSQNGKTDIPLVRFGSQSPKEVMHKWSALNDPVRNFVQGLER